MANFGARGLGSGETGTGLPVFLARRAEDVQYQSPVRSAAKTVRNVPRCLPEVAGLDVVLDAILYPYPAAFQQDAPLLLRMAVDFAGAVGADTDHRHHDVLAGKNACAHAPGEIARDSLGKVVQIEELLLRHVPNSIPLGAFVVRPYTGKTCGICPRRSNGWAPAARNALGTQSGVSVSLS